MPNLLQFIYKDITLENYVHDKKAGLHRFLERFGYDDEMLHIHSVLNVSWFFSSNSSATPLRFLNRFGNNE